MGTIIADLTMSLDGFIAGPNAGPQNALGDGGDRLHQWQYDVESWRERQSLSGGQTNADDQFDREVFARVGAYVMGRRMFDEGEVGWSDPPPFRAPVFIVTHQARDPWIRQGGTAFTFVTEGFDRALEHARAAAGEKDIRIAGGANAVQQAIKAGLLDELRIHIAPILLGAGVRSMSTESRPRSPSTSARTRPSARPAGAFH